MSYGALDDKFHSHPKTLKAGNAGVGVFCRALSYCADHLTDGFVPTYWTRSIATKALLKKVTDAGFWVEAKEGDTYDYISSEGTYTVTVPEDGYFIRDFLTHNPTRETVIAKRSELSAKRAEAGRKGAMTRWHPGSKRDDKPMANEKQPDSPLPHPLPPPLTTDSSTKPVSQYEAPDEEIAIEMVKGHALRLVAALREGSKHRPSRVKEDILTFVRWLSPGDFERVREELLEHRSDIKYDGRWVLKRLEKLSEISRAQQLAEREEMSA